MPPRSAADILHDLFCRFLHRPGFLSHLRSLKGYDEPEILPYSTRRNCLIGADAGHLMHQLGLVTLDEVGRPPVAAEQLFQFLAGDAGEESRVGNLVAVEMQNRQHRAVGYWIEELVRMPCGGQRPRLRLTVPDDAGDDEIGIVEHRSERMAE